MKYSEKQISYLKDELEKKLSKKRFLHTLGVLETAKYISKYFSEIDSSEISAAALLHDVAKEISVSEQQSILDFYVEGLSSDDKESESLFHSFVGPFIIERDFPDFSSPNILSAVRNHTAGSDGMTLFDEIIFLSDYIEPTRSYPSCIALRESFLRELECSVSETDRVNALHRASLESIENTIKSVLDQGRKLNHRTIETKRYLSNLINDKEK